MVRTAWTITTFRWNDNHGVEADGEHAWTQTDDEDGVEQQEANISS